jgi:outer membrane lipoprotein SlyB
MPLIGRALGAGCAAAVLLGAAQPAAAYDQTTHTHHHHHHATTSDQRSLEACRDAQRRSANTGTVAGAVGGGLIGYGLGGGHALGTVLGAGGGAVIGHQIGAGSHRC